jgi:hypothetical protein
MASPAPTSFPTLSPSSSYPSSSPSTSWPTSTPTAAPTYGEAGSTIVAIIFITNLLGIYLILIAYFIGGNIFYLDELKTKMINAYKQDIASVDAQKDSFNAELSVSSRRRRRSSEGVDDSTLFGTF